MNATLLPMMVTLGAAAISPGPNNAIVMTAGAQRGFRGASEAILGVLLGSVVLLGLSWTGVAFAAQGNLYLEKVLGLLGGGYLIWLGLRMFISQSKQSGRTDVLPTSAAAIAAFQLTNPKAWMLIATVVVSASGVLDIWWTGLLVFLVTGSCLAIWAFGGAGLAQIFGGRKSGVTFDAIMAGLLVLTGCIFVIEKLF